MKPFSIILPLLLLICCLAGCASGRPEKDSAASEAPADVTAAPEETIDGDCTYTVFCRSSRTGEGIEGVIVTFCTDTVCTPVTSGADGNGYFTGPPAEYHVEVIKIPDGWEFAGEESDWYTGLHSETIRIPFKEADK